MNTITEKTSIQYLDELHAAADAVTAAQNAHKPGTEIDGLKDTAKKALADYNKSVTDDFFLECMEQEDPVQYFIKTRYVPKTVKVNYKQSKKSGEWSNSIDPTDTKADLVEFANANGNNFKMFPGKRTWWYATQKLSYLLANAYNKELTEGNPKFKYDVDSAAEMFVAQGAISEDADLASKATLIKAIQLIFDNITEGTKATKHDVKYINDMMVKQGKKACQVVFQSPDKMAELITDAMYHQLTGTEYEVLTQGKGNK